MKKFTIRLNDVRDSYYGFIVAVLNYVNKKSSRLEVVEKYMDDNPDALSSDILRFISEQEDFCDDAVKDKDTNKRKIGFMSDDFISISPDFDDCIEGLEDHIILSKLHENQLKAAEQSEQHMELVDGEAIIEDHTSPKHNAFVLEIAQSLRQYVKDHNGQCKVAAQNVALYVNEILNDDLNFFLPDVMVVCNPGKIDEKGAHTVPLFVAEVTSEGTRKNDYNGKLEVYRKIGVEEYWVVDIQQNRVVIYSKSMDYIPKFVQNPAKLCVSVYPGLIISFPEW